ncbi:Phosphatidylinositol 3,5-bisphosphate-binding protein [Cryptotrichosporon argae]
MQVGRTQVSTLRPTPVQSIRFTHDARLFAVAGESGYDVWATYPLRLVRRQALPGMLELALPLPYSPLLVLQGGGPNPLYPPNKIVFFHDGLRVPVAELEFGERIRGVAARNGLVVVALLRRIIAFEYGVRPIQGVADETKSGFWVIKLNEWPTAENEVGLVAVSTAPGSTLLAFPGIQPGHLNLVHLAPCPPPARVPAAPAAPHPFRAPILIAHTSPLSALAASTSGAHVASASERGTLVRVWSTASGRMERELRRGVDRAHIWGVGFEQRAGDGEPEQNRRNELRRKGGRIVGWSDKGTVHVWAADDPSQPIKSSPAAAPPSLANLLQKSLPMPKYFSSAPSAAQFHLPRKNPHAFASALGAASAAAGVPSLRLDDDGDGDREWAEHFVVCWVEVEVDDDRPVAPPASGTAAAAAVGAEAKPGKRHAMGSRDERGSFGSDAASTRTATPSLGRRADTPTMPGSSAPMHVRHASAGSVRRHHRRPATETGPAAPASAPPKKKERQLVAITYSGDWYRLRLPREDDDDESMPKGKCELVEYRRFSVGTNAW